MEFIDVMRIKKRMCEKNVNNCAKCPLSLQNNSKGYNCSGFSTRYPQEYEDICKKWSEENPLVTNADKFKEVFGKIPDIDFYLFINSAECNKSTCSGCKYEDFWKKEYKEPKKD